MSDIHLALARGNTALVTGGASGIGLAAAKAFARLAMNVVIVDLGKQRLDAALGAIEPHFANKECQAAAFDCDVSSEPAIEKMKAAVLKRFGTVDVLMNNAGIGLGSGFDGPLDTWRKVIDVNLWGIINMTHAFLPAMLDSDRDGLIINAGSKQGITCPPGDPAYNISKAGVKVFTEALEHDLRNRAGSKLSAKLLIPGFVFTNMTKGDRKEKPDAAWTPEQTVDFMLESIKRDDFYILCPDNDVPRALDEKRIAWAAGDIVENRPPLSRWHRKFSDAFKAFSEQ